jgi:ketosteroid isomerase-like protein
MRAAHSIIGSGSSPLPRAPRTRPEATTDHDAVERVTQTFNAHDLDGLEDVLADDVICRGPGGVEEQGRAACVEFHRRWLADFPDAQLEVRARHVIDDVVVEEGTFRGTHDGVARTGRSVSLDYVRVARIRYGKHVSLTVMFDRLLMLEQLGLADESSAGEI